MTTDQIRAASPESLVTTPDSTTLVDAEEEARQIVAKARYEAFRMVTDARDEAEALLSEARTTHDLSGEPDTPLATPPVRERGTDHDDPAQDAARLLEEAQSRAQAFVLEARAEADTIVNQARAEADTVLDRARAEADTIVAEASERVLRDHADLLAEQTKLEGSVQRTRGVLMALEARLAAIAQTPTPSPEVDPLPEPHATTVRRSPEASLDPVVTSDTAIVDGGSPIEQVPIHAREDAHAGPPTVGSHTGQAIDYAPSVPAPAPASEPTDEEDGRGSFYSRRSAKLPRIGDSAGHDALDAMRAVRMTLDQ